MERPHYARYDVMAEQGAWDAHTREVVARRLATPGRPVHLEPGEAKAAAAVVRRLVADDRADVVDFVVAHIDGRMGAGYGEGQRKAGLPPLADLIHAGLRALGGGFAARSAREQDETLTRLSRGELPGEPELPQQEFFAKLLELTLEAYASHPLVWSEIGYAGPAYPRGYYRLGRKIRDPWEPPLAREGPAGAVGPGASAGVKGAGTVQAAQRRQSADPPRQIADGRAGRRPPAAAPAGGDRAPLDGQEQRRPGSGEGGR